MNGSFSPFRTGGFAALNHRLMAAKPAAWEGTKAVVTVRWNMTLDH
jgi:hypothetical protein